ncbi:hypothetical protein Hamer_G002726 [Homarus americanus]|uniref:Uncharacterized protein n=1 Tax=Homarus americanus TaxID=6706 RepID=A0A8J5JSI0_HOMAM|nr:hypothetical protein Hamer_G002726 [Homarus americanus]
MKLRAWLLTVPGRRSIEGQTTTCWTLWPTPLTLLYTSFPASPGLRW